jgi:dTMP kinase
MTGAGRTRRTVARGRFVVFEGLDGAGTSTQLALLQEWLRARGHAADATREPSEGPIGSLLRQVIDGRLDMDATALALAFAADRVDHVRNGQQGIQRSLDAGRWVLCDRYVASAVAYQLSQDVPFEWLLSINRMAPTPDVTVFVDTDPAVCVERIAQRESRYALFHDLAKLSRVRDDYRRALERPEVVGELVTLDGNRPADEVFGELSKNVEELLRRLSPD